MSGVSLLPQSRMAWAFQLVVAGGLGAAIMYAVVRASGPSTPPEGHAADQHEAPADGVCGEVDVASSDGAAASSETTAEARLDAAERRLRELEESQAAARTHGADAPAPTAPVAPEASASVARGVEAVGAGPDDTGYLSVGCKPSCDRIIVDGRNRGPSPLVKLGLKPGKHEVVVARDAEQRTHKVEIRPGEKADLRVKFDD